MTPTECAEIIAEMTATWPQREMTKPEGRVWHDELRGRQAHLARQAVRALRAVCDWLPTHNQFIAAYQSAARREAMERPALPEAPPPGTSNRVTSRDLALSAVAEMRAKLPAPGARRSANQMAHRQAGQPERTEAE